MNILKTNVKFSKYYINHTFRKKKGPQMVKNNIYETIKQELLVIIYALGLPQKLIDNILNLIENKNNINLDNNLFSIFVSRKKRNTDYENEKDNK